MPNQLDANGLQIASLNEIVDAITASLKSPAVYGPDINTDPNTPDGQMINIFAQSVEDMLETLLDTYNAFFVDSAYGVVLDQLVALNGLARKAGSYTRTYVEVTTSGAVTIPGQDTATPFTVADDAGNQYQLLASYAFAGVATAMLEFQAVTLGQVQVVANTITNVVTTTLGVTSVNNPAFSVATTGTASLASGVVTAIPDTTGMRAGMIVTSSAFPGGTVVNSVDSSSQVTLSQNATAAGTVNLTVATPPTAVGTTEETDVQLKIRRAQSFYLQTVGPADAIRAAILELADVSDCYVAENDTGSTAGGVPAHGVWVIVNGGTAAEIGQAIYAKKAPGCDMKGSQTYVVARPQGNTFTAKWDNAIPENFYVRATLNSRIPGLVFDLSGDATKLAAALVYKLGQSPNIGDVILAMATIEPNAVISTVNVSTDGSTWEDIITPSDFQHYFFLAAGNVTLTQA